MNLLSAGPKARLAAIVGSSSYSSPSISKPFEKIRHELLSCNLRSNIQFLCEKKVHWGS